ncbi:MAG: ferrochelatase, partial [Nitrospirae bacterium]|nr:ferrochelatase [Nitrospirota bacterium]
MLHPLAQYCILYVVIGVILLNLGGPDSIAAIKPFLHNLFSDRDIIRLGPGFLQKTIASIIIRAKLKKTVANYNLIGGKSPLLSITSAQAEALAKQLNANAESQNLLKYKVYVGMRYWHPFTEESLEQMHKEGIKKVIAISLYPHYSVATTGSSIKHFRNAAAKYPLEYACVTSWFNHPLYIEALAERIREGLKSFDSGATVLFSAHSLPKKLVDAGDPYVNEIRATIEALAEKLNLQWHLSYQSKTGPVKWLEPTTDEMLHELASKGIKDLLVV